MSEIFVVVEHRQGEVRDITYEMLFKADALCREFSHTLTAVLLGGKAEAFLKDIAPKADRVLVFEDERFKTGARSMWSREDAIPALAGAGVPDD